MRKQSAQGTTFIELAIVVAILVIMASFGMMAWTSMGEARDATMVQAAQASLQTVISQGAARMDIAPSALNGANVVTAMNSLLQRKAGAGSEISFTTTGAGNYQITVTGTGRGANFTMNATSGDITISALTGNWSEYAVQNGAIAKN